MKLYVVRHGQTDYNLNHLMQGIIDNDINKNGEKEIRYVKDVLSNIQFDICISSPLIRAINSLKIITDHKYIIDNRIIERNLGIFETKESELYNKELYWDYKANSNFGGVEPIQDLFNRVQDFYNELKTNYSDKTILIVSHDAPIRALNYIIKGFDENTKFLDLVINNGCILEYEI